MTGRAEPTPGAAYCVRATSGLDVEPALGAAGRSGVAP